MNAEEEEKISFFLTAVHKFLFVCDLMAPAKVRVAQVHWAGDVQFAGDTDAASASAHLNHIRILYENGNTWWKMKPTPVAGLIHPV